MGTSSSSKGPGSGVPMVPPWVPDAPDAGDGPVATPPQPQQPVPVTDPTTPPPATTPLAPPGRFNGTRRNLSKFGSSGNKDSLRRGVGHYVKKGYGGSGTAAKRFSGTARTAGALHSALSGGGLSGTNPARDDFETACRAGGPPESIVTALVEALRPVDGSQDAEANRKSLAEAVTDLLVRFPNADLLNLTEEQRMSVVARFVGFDVFNRFALDVGKAILDNAPSVATGMSRMREAKEYIRETVIAAFNKLLTSPAGLKTADVVRLVRTALRDAFDIFQGYTE